jgi:hypothetical protein
MINSNDINIRMLIHVAKRLGNLREKVVFVGGCATGLQTGYERKCTGMPLVG